MWWLLVPNPFVIIADAAPMSPTTVSYSTGEDLLSMLRIVVRNVSRAPATEIDECTNLYEWNPAYSVEYYPDGTTVVLTRDGTVVNVPPSPVKPFPDSENYPVWPWGLGVNLLLGGLFFYITVSRLRIPYDTLAKGTRVA